MTKSVTLIVAVAMLVSFATQAGVPYTYFNSKLPENTYPISGYAGQQIVVQLEQYTNSKDLQVLYYSSGSNLLGSGGVQIAKNQAFTVLDNLAYIRINNPKPIPSAIIFNVKIYLDADPTVVLYQQNDISVHIQGVVKGSTSYQFAKFFFPNIASGAGSCRLKIIPGKEDLLALVYKYDILGYKLFSNFIGSVDVGGGNFDVTQETIYVVVYFTNNSLPGTVVTSVTDLSIRNIDDIGNTKCGIGCSKTGMRFNPTKPFGCECINPDYKYNPVTDICDCVTNCGSVPPPLACGNGYIDGCEQCDFGTAENNGVVCYPNCTLVEDSGYACRYETDATDPKLVKSICPPICGDFIIRGNEECDEFGPQCSQCLCTDEYPYNQDTQKCQNVCGDGIMVDGEECDFLPLPTGCSAECKLLDGYYLEFDQTTGLPSGVEPICGDGIQVEGQECDIESAGCQECKQADGYDCTPDNGIVTECNPICGDGKLVCGEECDLGSENDVSKNVAGSGCNSCQLEDGYYPDAPAGAKSICGDGIQVKGQACDIESPGCINCQQVSGYDCTPDNGIVTECNPICGDGITVCGEECDLGSDVNGISLNTADSCCVECKAIADKCYCRKNDDYLTVCIEKCAVCGDGYLDQGQECDDGNIAGNDGCNPQCKIEGASLDNDNNSGGDGDSDSGTGADDEDTTGVDEDTIGDDEDTIGDDDEDTVGVDEDTIGDDEDTIGDDDEDTVGVDEDTIGDDEDTIGDDDEDTVGVDEDTIGDDEDTVGVDEDTVGVDEDTIGDDEDTIGDDDEDTVGVDEDTIGDDEDTIGDDDEDTVGVDEDTIGDDEDTIGDDDEDTVGVDEDTIGDDEDTIGDDDEDTVEVDDGDEDLQSNNLTTNDDTQSPSSPTENN